MAGLQPKQKKFVEEYPVDLNATQAAIRAGYSKKGAAVTGSKLLINPNVQDALAAQGAISSAKLAVTRETVLAEMLPLGFSNMLDYVRINSEGDAWIDLTNLTREQASAISEITIDEYTEGRGDDKRDIKRTKFKLYDKGRSLVDIAKMLGVYIDRKEVSGLNGGPIETVDKTPVSDRMRAQAAVLLFAKAAKEAKAARAAKAVKPPKKKDD